MSEIKKGKFCHNCKRQVLHTAPKTNHLLHFFLTFLTCGAWSLLWGIEMLMPKTFICSQCGSVYSWLRSRSARSQVKKARRQK